MSNGSGFDEYDTPTDPPPLAENVPYIKAVGALVLQLSALNSNLAGAVHEMRLARQPVADGGLVAKLRGAFQTLKDIAISGEQAFEK